VGGLVLFLKQLFLIISITIMINITKPIIGSEEIEAVVRVLESGMIVQGPITKDLEDNFAKYCGAKYAVAFNSGTAAIHAGLYALNIEEGDEVITSPFTFVATANPILMSGGRVVFADISPEDFNIDPEAIIKKITPKTKAIIPVDLYGQIYNWEEISKIAIKYRLKILEDACQAVGADYCGKKAGNFGDISAFSLYATKNLMAGEGGLITTNNREYAERCRVFRHHGQSEKTRYEYLDLGYNYRITDIFSAIAQKQLEKIEELNSKRIDNAKALLSGLSNLEGLILPTIKENFRHVFHQFTIRVTAEFKLSRDELARYLKEKGIGTGIYYPKPLHLHKHFLKMGYREGDFPIAEQMSKEVLSLPVHPSLTSKDIDLIISSIKKI
jgi:perosamine synthetase